MHICYFYGAKSRARGLYDGHINKLVYTSSDAVMYVRTNHAGAMTSATIHSFVHHYVFVIEVHEMPFCRVSNDVPFIRMTFIKLF